MLPPARRRQAARAISSRVESFMARRHRRAVFGPPSSECVTRSRSRPYSTTPWMTLGRRWRHDDVVLRPGPAVRVCRACYLGWATFDFCPGFKRIQVFPMLSSIMNSMVFIKINLTLFRGCEKWFKMTIFAIFGLKLDKITHKTLTSEKKQTVMNKMNRTGIQLSFCTTFILVSLLLKWVFPSLKQNFVSGAPLVAGFESRPRQHFSRERDTNFSQRRGLIEVASWIMWGYDYIWVCTLSFGLVEVIKRY